MSWVKVDDGFPNNPKVAHLTDRAFRLHMCGLCYCGRNLTDGALAGRAVNVVVAEAAATKKHVAELHHAGLWNRAGDGYVINDYLEYNPSREGVLKEREEARERMRRLRSGGSSGERSGELTGERNGERSPARSGVRSGTPSRPVEELKPLAVESEFERLLRASRAAKP